MTKLQSSPKDVDEPQPPASGGVLSPAAAAEAATTPSASSGLAGSVEVTSNPAKKTPKKNRTAPPGYKLVKVAMPDGSVVVARKKLKPEEIKATTEQAIPTTSSGSHGRTGDSAALSGAPSNSIDPGRDTRNSDGSGTSDITTSKESTHPDVKGSATVNPATVAADNTKDLPKAGGAAKGTRKKGTSAKKVSAASDRQGAAEDGIETDPVEVAMDEDEKREAHTEQNQRFRDQRVRRFKNAILGGAFRVAESSLPDIEIGYHHSTDNDDLPSLSDSDVSIDTDISIDNDEDDREHNDADDDDIHDSLLGSQVTMAHGDIEQGGSVHALHDATPGSVHLATGAAVQSLGATVTRTATSKTHSKQKMPSGTEGEEKTKKGNAGYKVTSEELKVMDEAAKQRLARPLGRRWANFAFYLMASLSIILPLLFVILGVFITKADKQNAATGNWVIMPDIIKGATTAWAIVFAAVVAQLLRTWATYRVERGMRLMELEQLVGSSSFAAAAKQPLMLRRLDILSLSLLAIWCLSPLGSYSLQHTLQIQSLPGPSVPSAAYYFDNTGSNRLLNNLGAAPNQAAYQGVSLTFGDVFLERLGGIVPENVWKQPKLLWNGLPNSTYKQNDPKSLVSNAGIPIVLSGLYDDRSNHGLPDDDSAYAWSKNVTFMVKTSYFAFKCRPWSIVQGDIFSSLPADLDLPSDAKWSTSPSKSCGCIFYTDDPDHFTINRLRFASAIHGVLDTPTPFSLDTAPRGVIDCGFVQQYVNVYFECSLSTKADTHSPDCQQSSSKAASSISAPDLGTAAGGKLRNFQDEFMAISSPPPLPGADPDGFPTPLEQFLSVESFSSDRVSSLNTLLNLTNRDPPSIASGLSLAFNTFVDLANVDTFSQYGSLSGAPDTSNDQSAFKQSSDATARFIGPTFVLQLPYIVIFMLSSALLLLGGILSVAVETRLVAPDVLGYVSTVVRNSRHLQLPPTKMGGLRSGMSGGERAYQLRDVEVMMQDVSKPGASTGKIALGMKRESARPLQSDRLYR